MLRFLSGPARSVRSLSRREWLRIGSLAGLGWIAGTGRSVATPQSGASAKYPGFGKAKSVILIYASGGQSQFETWDPKPDAPDGIRGEFGAIPTSVPGTFVGEHMPRLAKLADRYTIVRSVSHEDRDHGSATHLALTGQYHARRSSNPPATANDYPTYGAVLKRVRPLNRFPYDAIHVNAPALTPRFIAPGQDGGLLGREFEPLVVGDVTETPVAVPCLDAQLELSPDRLAAREGLKTALDGVCLQLERNRTLLDMDNLYRQAFELLSSPRSRRAFDLGDEDPKLRDRYGRHRSGQACLLARRLVEAGVPLVTVMWNHCNRGQDIDPTSTDQYGWDTHNDIFYALKQHLLPRFDESFAALIEDLDARGLLSDTLVVCMGEFGRSPRIALEPGFKGKTPGRKHWPSVYSVAMAGAGIKRGAIYGASDDIGGTPLSDRVGPWDIAATMYSALGVDPAGHYTDALERPFPICTGKPIAGLY